MSTQDDVFTLLQEAEEQNLPPLSVRSLRTRLGKGSYSTIAKARTAWLNKKAEEALQPIPIPEETVRELGNAVWKTLQPFVSSEVEQVRTHAQRRIEIETTEAQSLLQIATETLDEANQKELRFRELSSQLEQETKERLRLSTELNNSRHECESLQAKLKDALEELHLLKVELEKTRTDKTLTAAVEIAIREVLSKRSQRTEPM